MREGCPSLLTTLYEDDTTTSTWCKVSLKSRDDRWPLLHNRQVLNSKLHIIGCLTLDLSEWFWIILALLYKRKKIDLTKQDATFGVVSRPWDCRKKSNCCWSPCGCFQKAINRPVSVLSVFAKNQVLCKLVQEGLSDHHSDWTYRFLIGFLILLKTVSNDLPY